MLALRPARPEDEASLLRWRNDASTRQASLNQHTISAAEHHAWFSRRLKDPSCLIRIIEEDGRPVGQVRLDRTAPHVAHVSVVVARGARDRGLGREALRLACEEARRALGVTQVRAMVRRENLASLRMFRAVGFAPVGGSHGVVELVG